MEIFAAKEMSTIDKLIQEECLHGAIAIGYMATRNFVKKGYVNYRTGTTRCYAFCVELTKFYSAEGTQLLNWQDGIVATETERLYIEGIGPEDYTDMCEGLNIYSPYTYLMDYSDQLSTKVQWFPINDIYHEPASDVISHHEKIKEEVDYNSRLTNQDIIRGCINNPYTQDQMYVPVLSMLTTLHDTVAEEDLVNYSNYECVDRDLDDCNAKYTVMNAQDQSYMLAVTAEGVALGNVPVIDALEDLMEDDVYNEAHLDEITEERLTESFRTDLHQGRRIPEAIAAILLQVCEQDPELSDYIESLSDNELREIYDNYCGYFETYPDVYNTRVEWYLDKFEGDMDIFMVLEITGYES